MFFNGFNSTNSKNYLYELHVDTGGGDDDDDGDGGGGVGVVVFMVLMMLAVVVVVVLVLLVAVVTMIIAPSNVSSRRTPGSTTIVAHIPGIVQVCINAYSSKTQTFYLTAQSDDRTGNKVLFLSDVWRLKRLFPDSRLISSSCSSSVDRDRPRTDWSSY